MSHIKINIHSLYSVLQAEDEFRDKLSPIVISLNFSLDPQSVVAQTALRPVLNYQTEQLIEQKVCVLLLKNINRKQTLHKTIKVLLWPFKLNTNNVIKDTVVGIVNP